MSEVKRPVLIHEYYEQAEVDLIVSGFRNSIIAQQGGPPKKYCRLEVEAILDQVEANPAHRGDREVD